MLMQIAKLLGLSNVTEVRRVTDALAAVPRTGWVRRGVSRPENDLEHTEGLLNLADNLASELPELDLVRLKQLLAVHEWPEIVVGDIVTATLPPEERRAALAAKHDAEGRAMWDICLRFGRLDGQRLFDLWREFEDGETPEAAVARQLDKLQAMIQAGRYELAGEPVRARDFLDGSCRPVIVHPVLRAALADLDRMFPASP